MPRITEKPIVAPARNASSSLSAADISEGKALSQKEATLFIEGAPLKALRVADSKVLDSGSFDGTSSKTTLVKTTNGLLVEQDDVNDGGGAGGEGGGAPGFADSRNFLLMNQAGFAFALANGRTSAAPADRVKFIKQNMEGTVVEKNIKPGTDALLFNGSELYTITGDKWTKVSLSRDD